MFATQVSTSASKGVSIAKVMGRVPWPPPDPFKSQEEAMQRGLKRHEIISHKDRSGDYERLLERLNPFNKTDLKGAHCFPT